MAQRHFRACEPPRIGEAEDAMTLTELLADLLTRFATDPWLLVPIIVTATFVLEDLATVTVAVLASHMVIDGNVALAAAIVGTALGDIALYAAARWARGVPFVSAWLSRPLLNRTLDWVRRHALPMVVVARFVPGLRLPVFAGAGAVRMPALPFVATIIVTTLLWTPGLYWSAAQLGAVHSPWSGAIGWAAVLGLAGALLAAPRLATGLIVARGEAR
jgi:membrane protein DedA with SNARE-associated domain